MTDAAVRILVADDHPLYRRGLAALLSAHEGWEVVAEVDDGIGAVSAAHTTQPDVVVMDRSGHVTVAVHPGDGGEQIVPRAAHEDPERAVLVVVERGAAGVVPGHVGVGSACSEAVTACVDERRILLGQLVGVEAEASRQAARGQVRNYEPLWRIKAAGAGRSTSAREPSKSSPACAWVPSRRVMAAGL